MNTQVLVAYATKYGATAEIAEKIGQVLRQAGLRTDVLVPTCYLQIASATCTPIRQLYWAARFT
jgi:menaquinone-dependent protoporphyrinogen IX oxidase